MTFVYPGQSYVIREWGDMGSFFAPDQADKNHPIVQGHTYIWMPWDGMGKTRATYLGPTKEWQVGQRGDWQYSSDRWTWTVQPS
jgi:hypothetical protein